LNACAPSGDYRVTLEAYDPKTMQSFGEVVALGTTRADASLSNRLEDLAIDVPLDVEVAPQARLLGYTLTPDQVRPGDPFSLSLFWRGTANSGRAKIVVGLRDSQQQAWQLAELDLAMPPEGRGMCSFFDLRVPADFPPGTAGVWVNNSKIANLQVVR
jgi:hypothetical protein